MRRLLPLIASFVIVCILVSDALAFGPCSALVTTSSTSSLSSSPFVGSSTPTFASLTAAQLALRSGALPRNASGPTVVCLDGSVFNEVLAFGGEDGGEDEAHRVIYTALPGTQPVVSGSLAVALQPAAAHVFRTFPSLRPLAGSLFTADLSAVANLSAASTWVSRGFANGCQPAPLELVYGGAVQTVARWPNANASLGTSLGFTLTEWVAPGTESSSFWVNASQVPFLSYADPSALWFHGFWFYEWSDEVLQFDGVQEVQGDLVRVGVRASPGRVVPSQGVTNGARYFAENALEALDAPGEYFVNVSTRTLYFYAPDDGLQAASVTVNTTLATVTGASFLSFVGIEFSGARGGGASLVQTRGVQFVNCTFRNLGETAVSVFQSNDTRVQGSLIEDVGCAGVRASEGGARTATALVPSGTLVLDNTIRRFERLVFTYQQGIGLDSGGVAAHNEVSDAPHSALTLSGNDCLVVGNVIHHTVRATFDNAAIYWYPTDWSKQNATIWWNLLYANGQDPSTCNEQTSCNRDAIYPDNGNAGVNIVGNVVWHPNPWAAGAFRPCPHCHPASDFSANAILNDGGRDMNATNNLFVLDGANGSFNGAAGITWDQAQQSNGSAYFSELRAVAWNEGLWATRYPRLAALHDWWPAGGAVACAADPACGPAPFGNSISTNVFVNATTLMVFPPPSAQFNDSAFAIENNLFNEDPEFEDPNCRASLNFQLKPSSPAYALGFQRIPMECFGVGKRCIGTGDLWFV